MATYRENKFEGQKVPETLIPSIEPLAFGTFFQFAQLVIATHPEKQSHWQLQDDFRPCKSRGQKPGSATPPRLF